MFIPYRLPDNLGLRLSSLLKINTLQELIMPTRNVHLLTMKLNKDKRMTKQQKLNKKMRNSFQMVMRKPVLQSVNF